MSTLQPPQRARGIAVSISALLFLAPAATAQSTWSGSVSNLWADAGNWSAGVPTSGTTALFSGGGNGNTSIDLGGTSRPVKTVEFDTATAYTIGTLGSGDALTVSSGGSFFFTGNVTTTQTVNAVVANLGTLALDGGASVPLTLVGGLSLGGTVTGAGTVNVTGPITFSAAGPRTINNTGGGAVLTLGSAATPSTVTVGSGSVLILNSTGSVPSTGSLVVNDAIVGAGSVSILSPLTGTLAGQNTYSGGTTLGATASQSPDTVVIGTGTNGPPGSITSGPFGTGTVTVNTTPGTSPANLQTTTGPLTIANPFTLATGLTVTGFPVTLTGTVTTQVGVTLTYTGGTATTTTVSGPVAVNQTMTLAGTGNILVSGSVADAGGGQGRLSIPGGGGSGTRPTVQVTGANIYTGGTSVTNGGYLLVDNTTGSGTGSGPVTAAAGGGLVGSGGAVGGAGTIAGTVTISSTTASQQGGVISPGPKAQGPATLAVGPMVWDPRGQYKFDYNPAVTTPGNGINDEIVGAGGLDLSNLSSANPFTITPLRLSLTAQPGAETWTLGTFATGVTGPGGVAFVDGTDVTGLFAVSVANATAAVTVVGPSGGPQTLDLTISPVPEPGSLLLLGAAAIGAVWRRRNIRYR